MVVIQAISRNQVFLRYYSAQVTSSLPVIRIPEYVKKYVDEAKRKKAERLLSLKKRISYRGDTSFPIISSTDKEYNFYLGQRYNEHYPLPLQSKYWFKAKSAGQKFTIHPWDTNPSLPVLYNDKHKNDIYFPKTFHEILSDENLLQVMRDKGYECPTPIQVISIPAILEHKHLLLAGETGAGKTLAYLAPIIQNISAVKKSTKLFPDTPLAVIITPSRELAEQIGFVGYELCRKSDLNVRVLVRDGCRYEHLKLTENSDVDILVASAGILSKLVLKGIFKLTNARHIVLEEADTLLDDSFIENTHWLLRRIPLYISSTESLSPEHGTQLILVSSTYPLGVNDLLTELFEDVKDDVVKIKSPYLHRILPHVRQRFWRVNNDNRSGILLDLVKSDYKNKVPVLIFCTHSPTCDWMSQFLETNGVPNVKFHAAISQARRARNLDAFMSGLCSVMCSTDLASRGLDTQHVKHVINFDFPTSVSDYILRVGRVGRVGSNQGHVTNLVVSKAGVYAVNEIERAVRTSTRIPNVDANIKKKLNKLYFGPPS